MEKYRRNLKYALTREKYLSDEEQKSFNNCLGKFKDKDFRNTTLLWMALHTGGRASEVLNIEYRDIDFENQAVFIRGLKGSDNREIPLPPWLFKRLARLAAEGSKPFPISYKRYYQIWCDYRPVKKSLHSLRHTFAINLYRKTQNVRVLQIALGHKSWKNTMIYAEYQYKTDELRKAILG